MRELKNLCLHLGLATQSEKIHLIENIQIYLTTGKIVEQKEMPAISKVKPKTVYLLAPQTVMLKDSFKNDQKRVYF